MRKKNKLTEFEHVFHWRDLVNTGDFSIGGARVRVNRWAKDEKITPIGSRTGLYINHSVKADKPLYNLIITRHYPEAIISREAALHKHGWLKEEPKQIDIIHVGRLIPADLPNIESHIRPKVTMKILSAEKEEDGLTYLTAESAMIELLATEPQKINTLALTYPETIDLDDLRNKAAKLCEAFENARTSAYNQPSRYKP